MVSALNSLRSCNHPLGAWIELKATVPDLFHGYQLRGDLSDQIVWSAAKDVRENKPFGRTLSGVANHFSAFVREDGELESIRTRLKTKFGLDPLARPEGQASAVQRFLKTGGWHGLLEPEDVTTVEKHLLANILIWARKPEDGRVPLERSLGSNPIPPHSRLPDLADLLYNLKSDECNWVLPIIYGAGMAHMIPLPDFVSKQLLSVLEQVAQGDLSGAKALVFNDPIDALSKIAEGNTTTARGQFVSIHLPAFVHGLASPAYLMNILSALPVNRMPLVPSLQMDDNGREFVAFMAAHGFDRLKVKRWYEVTSALEPELKHHLSIALSARLKEVFLEEAGRSSHADYYEDVLERVVKRVELSFSQLDAWLNWKYEWPEVDGVYQSILQNRFYAYRNRGAMVELLGLTLMNDPTIDRLRRKERRPKTPALPWDDTVRQVRLARDRFHSSYTKTQKKNLLRDALNKSGIEGTTYEKAHAALMVKVEEWEEIGVLSNSLRFLSNIDELLKPRGTGEKKE